MYNNKWFTKPKPGIQLNRSHPLARGLVLYWAFNEGSGSIAYDTSGYGNNGTLSGLALSGNTSNWVGSRLGGGLDLDSSNDYVICSKTGPDLTGDYWTICYWVKPTSAAISAQCVLISTSIFNTGGFYGHFDTDGTVTMNTCQTGAQQESRSAAGLVVAGKWNFIAIVKRGTSIKFYGNGAESVNAVSGTHTNCGATSNPLRIGGYISGGYKFSGVIDETRIYNNRALTETEIKTLYVNPHIDFHGSKTKLFV